MSRLAILSCVFQTILFTMDENILERVSQYDQSFEAELLMDEEGYEEETYERPSTADKGEIDQGVR